MNNPGQAEDSMDFSTGRLCVCSWGVRGFDRRKGGELPTAPNWKPKAKHVNIWRLA